jgi:hypothetical protein
MARSSNNQTNGNIRSTSRPDANELAMMLDPTASLYGITARETKGMRGLLDSSVNPFNALPVAPGSEYFDAMAIYHDDYYGMNEEDEEQGLDDSETAGYYYNPYDLSKGKAGTNFAPQGAMDYSDAPAPLSIIPTSTMNYKRPRTVAAGYDPTRKVLTVVFRDGTFYNYHEVEPARWGQFKAAYSKGRFILRYMDDNYPHGIADMAGMPNYARETLYRIARTNQLFYEYNNKATKTGGKVGREKHKQGIVPIHKANNQPKTALKSNKGNKKRR